MRVRERLENLMVRRKVGFDSVPVDRLELRLARSVEDYEQAFRLLHFAYAYEGYSSLGPVELRATEQHLLPEANVLVAYEGERLRGTVTVTLDSPAGLPLDKDFPEELGALRKQGARLAELGSLAVVGAARRTGASQLLELAAFRLGHQALGATHYVLGVHPRGVPYFRAIWGLRPLASARQHADLSAPVVGMVATAERGVAILNRHFRKPLANGYRPVDYIVSDVAPPGLTLPENLPPESWARWKLSREVFRELFMRRTTLLRDLSERTRSHLESKRTDRTLGRMQLKAV